MKNNREELIKQFIAAKGIKDVDVESKTFLEEFSSWLKERKAIGNKYIEWLKKFGLFQDNTRCAEVGKGIHDSITLPYHTKLLTPYIDDNIVNNSDRVIKAKFLINPKMKAPTISTEDITLKVVSNKEISTYMTQNPYGNILPDNLEHLHNSGYNNIVVGVYGNTNDKDIEEKKEMLRRFKSKLEGNVKDFDITINDDYFYVIGSKEENTRKNR